MLEAQRASVQPRVISPECGYVLPLTDLLEPYLGQRGVIEIHGARGSGKSTALRHLAAVLPDRLILFDSNAERERIEHDARRSLVIAVARHCEHLAEFTMAPWGIDEALEYLMAAHPEHCADVMHRFAGCFGDFEGACPGLWTDVLDEMVRAAGDGPRDALARLASHKVVGRWGGFPLVPVLREARRIAERVMQPDSGAWPAVPDEATLAEVVRLLARLEFSRPNLRAVFDDPDLDRQPLAASLLVGLREEWRPTDNRPACFAGAYLDGIEWANAKLPGVSFVDAHVSRADLRSAVLERADFSGAHLRSTQLDEARLTGACFDRAELARTCLSCASAPKISFRAAGLVHANLEASDLCEADLTDADLRDARLVGAKLRFVTLVNARIEGADFSHADLTGANLRLLNLRDSTWRNGRFEDARLDGCQGEGLELPDALFNRACLSGASLTASCMPRASFRGADLRGARLAEISWEGADLRGANLSFAHFHMGSSRSGLVESDVPCEGSRTGYYTDEFNEQAYRAPEEIRKANLRGADLRGARIHGTDFYLVDLRDAHYDDAQAEHFRRCGAILRTKRM